MIEEEDVKEGSIILHEDNMYISGQDGYDSDGDLYGYDVSAGETCFRSVSGRGIDTDGVLVGHIDDLKKIFIDKLKYI